MASKEFYTALPDSINQNLYWPDNPDYFDMLRMDVFKFVPISTIETTNASGETLITDVQSKGKDKKSLANILLPVPESINYIDSPQWSDERVGAIGKLAGSLAKSAANNNSQELGATLQKLAGAGLGPYVLQQISKLGGPSGEAITQGAAGVILNPYIEQIFKGIAIRNFSFSWKLVPRSASEQVKIHNIIRALRYYSLPNYSGTSGLSEDPNADTTITTLQDRWLTVPNIFQLKWTYTGKSQTEINSLPKFKPCVLKAVNVNYTPDGVWATHITNDASLSGPAPVAYNLSLEFSETEIITSSDVKQGY